MFKHITFYAENFLLHCSKNSFFCCNTQDDIKSCNTVLYLHGIEFAVYVYLHSKNTYFKEFPYKPIFTSFQSAETKVVQDFTKNDADMNISYGSCIFHRVWRTYRQIYTFPRHSETECWLVHVTMPGAMHLASRASDSAPAATLLCTWILHIGATVSVRLWLDGNQVCLKSRHSAIVKNQRTKTTNVLNRNWEEFFAAWVGTI